MQTRPEVLSDVERTSLLESVLTLLEVRQDAKYLPSLLRSEVAQRRDMAWLARATKMNRTSLFRSLADKSNLKLDTLERILRAELPQICYVVLLNDQPSNSR